MAETTTASDGYTYTPMDPAIKDRFTKFQTGDTALQNEYQQKYGADWGTYWGKDSDAALSAYNEAFKTQGLDPAAVGTAWRTAYGSGWSGNGTDPGMYSRDSFSGINGEWFRSLTPAQRTAWLQSAITSAFGPMNASGAYDANATGYGNAYASGPFNNMSYGQYQMLSTLLKDAGLTTNDLGGSVASTGTGTSGSGSGSGAGAGGGGGSYSPSSTSGSGAGAAPPPPSSMPSAVAAQVGAAPPTSQAAQPDATTSLLQQAITSALTGNGGYSQQLLDQMRATGRGEIQAQYEEATRQLEGEMARRGIAASSIALERSSGLKGQNQRALASFETDLARQTEDALRSDRQNAMNAALTLRGQQAQEGQFAQTFGLSVAQFNQQAAQWAASYNLDQNRFAEATRQFNASLAEQQRQFGMSYDLQSAQFRAQAAQFAAQFGLDQNKFYEAIRQFNAQQAEQQRQFGLSYGLDQQKLSESQRQFNQSYTLQQQQIITSVIQSLMGKVSDDVLRSILQSFGINPASILGSATTSASGSAGPTGTNGATGGGGNNGDATATGAPTTIGTYNGQQQVVNGVTWVWNASTNTWTRANV